ncbi:PucR family transcriptional regulator [Peterkaempfera sp. SMS 1(5)a]|uniref:PucR family transcriptional regulator n=1 Tax=Peterkaempfera podocarpi TaxID=3232308 RepID=UPI00366DC7A7
MKDTPIKNSGSRSATASGAQGTGPRVLLAWSAERVRAGLPQVLEELVARLRHEVPAYGDPRRAPRDLEEQARSGIEAALRSLARPGQRDASAHHAGALGRLRGEQEFPLDALADGYRVAGTVIWEAVVAVVTRHAPEQVPQLVHEAVAVWELLDRDSRLAADAYREAARTVAAERGARVRALLDILLDGRADPDDHARIAVRLGLPEAGRYAIAAVDGTNGPLLPAARPLCPRLPGIRVLRTRRVDYDLLVAHLADRPTGELAAGLAGNPGARIGISSEVDGLAELPQAARLAVLALRTCSAGGEVAQLERRLPAALVAASPDLAAVLEQQVLGPLEGLDPDDRDLLLGALDAWLDCGGSVPQTAARLFCHGNTVRNRLRRLEQSTGLTLARPRDVVQLVLARDAWRIVRSDGTACGCGRPQPAARALSRPTEIEARSRDGADCVVPFPGPGLNSRQDPVTLPLSLTLARDHDESVRLRTGQCRCITP